MNVPRALITGATGFIGGAIAQHAVYQGWQVACACRTLPEQPKIEADWNTMGHWEECTSSRFNVVIHAAAQRHRFGVSTGQYLQTNVALTERALALAKKFEARLVFISSISVYGWPQNHPINESFPANPRGEYGQSKALCEKMIRAAGHPYTIVEPSITYGPGDTNGMIEKLLRMITKRRFIIPGLGRSRVQLVYIDDLAKITLRAALAAETLNQTFICTYRDPIYVGELARLVGKTVHRLVPPVGPPVQIMKLGALFLDAAVKRGIIKSEPPLTREKLETVSVDRTYTIDKMRELLKDEPQIGYQEGLKRTAISMGLF